MSTPHRYRRANLFLLRMWSEDVADGSSKVEWRGKVQRVVDGESHQFEGWHDLMDLLAAMLTEGNSTESGSGNEIKE